ncbi:hypothetical protein APTSU1_000018200 [Apodemus speciosus]|uniref:Uncharacterized protein n=1 Tax=Apodemus speciosus TaxID=105296 RepID=A0ABQ0ED08_APOSI
MPCGKTFTGSKISDSSGTGYKWAWVRGQSFSLPEQGGAMAAWTGSDWEEEASLEELEEGSDVFEEEETEALNEDGSKEAHNKSSFGLPLSTGKENADM